MNILNPASLQVSLDVLYKISPLLILFITALFLLLIEVLIPSEEKLFSALMGIWGLALATVASLRLWSEETQYLFQNSFSLDRFSLFFNFVFIAIAAIVILFSLFYLKQREMHFGEYYFLILCATASLMTMVSALDFLTFFLGLEAASLCFYVLTGLSRQDPRSQEAALKYFLLGAFSTGFLLYGMVLLYGAVGSIKFNAIAFFFTEQGIMNTGALLGLLLVLTGFAFKISAVPFHMWAPDVYEGAPTPITAFMATGVKAAAFGALCRFLVSAVPAWHHLWHDYLWIISILTMTVGNIAALLQNNIKRMLAYSSIAHAGYILIGFVSANKLNMDVALTSILFYLAVYSIMKIGAFGTIISLSHTKGERLSLFQFNGLGYRAPVAAAALSLFLISLAGIPPTAGFFAKLYIFTAAVKANEIPLAIVGIINSVIAAYYYLRVIVAMYMKETAEFSQPERSLATAAGLALCAWLILQLGLFPSSLLEIISQSISVLF